MKLTFIQWTIETTTICKETLTEETIESISNIDDEKLGGMFIQGYHDQNTPQEMVIILAAEI